MQQFTPKEELCLRSIGGLLWHWQQSWHCNDPLCWGGSPVDLPIALHLETSSVVIRFGLWPKVWDCGYKQQKKLSSRRHLGLDNRVEPGVAKSLLRWFGYLTGSPSIGGRRIQNNNRTIWGVKHFLSGCLKIDHLQLESIGRETTELAC